jgi:hypothetical protein
VVKRDAGVARTASMQKNCAAPLLRLSSSR